MSDSDGVESCQLIGFAGIMVQLVLGILSFSVLIYKRYIERPRRKWRIWCLDTSKQGVSQLIAHIINVAISMQLSSRLSSDACIWYFTTNILDNTLGVVLCVSVLGLIEKYLLFPNYTHFQSGNYYTISQQFEEERTISAAGNPNDPLLKPLEIQGKKAVYTISYFNWFIQFVIWNFIVIVSKSLVFELEVVFNQQLIIISTFLLGWIQPYQTFELILVIIIVPVIMNGFAFWFQDNFLKRKESSQPNPLLLQSQPQNQPDKEEEAQTSIQPGQLPKSQPRPDINDQLL